jgi:spermidine synthase
MNTDRLWRPNLIVFTSNACIMIIELVAGRIIAPYVGVSLYTWTGVIGVILAGMSLGNYLGGKLADRVASRRTLGLIFILAGLASLSVLGTIDFVGDRGTPAILPLVIRVVLFVAAIFFVPSAMLGGISPLVVKLTLQDLSRTGDVVGKIYASSAFGSIVGTFATGFFLISWFGTRAILLGVGMVLIALGILLGQWTQGWRRQVLAVGLLVGGTLLPPVHAILQGSCLRETNYFCIKVRDKELDDGSQVKVLILDRLVHSYTSLDDPRKLVYGYEKVYAEASQYLMQRISQPRALFIGGGGYTFPKYLAAVYPQTSIDVVEIDPGVTETAYDYLGLPRDGPIVTVNQDARLFIKLLDPARRYDLVLGDAFNDYSVPYHLTTREFNALVSRHLTNNGIYMVNLIDGRRREFLTAYLRAMKLTFDHVYLVPVGQDWETSVRSTFVVLASQQAIDLAALRQLDGGDGVRETASWLLPEDRLEALLAEGPQVILTDDYVPVDNLLAPVFEESEAQR